MNRCLSFFFWSLCCLSFDLRILITLLIYSKSSYCGVASTSGRLTTEIWHYLHLWYVVIFEKGYPMGYHPFVPLFVPSRLHRVASKEKQCTGLCENDIWVIHESFRISFWFDIQNDGRGQSNFQLDEIEEQKIVWIGEDTTKQNSLFAYYEQIEDVVWFCLLFYPSHSWKTGKTVKC